MKAKRIGTPKWTAVDRARHNGIREEFKNCPTQEDLQSSGDYEGPTRSGAYFSVRVLIHELKKVRMAAGLTLAAVAKRTGMDQATLSRLENGRQPNPTVDTLWRYAHAVGRRLLLTHTDGAAPEPSNGKPAKPGRGQSGQPKRKNK
jgi:DNA-binding XRE family transcriptional regulator